MKPPTLDASIALVRDLTLERLDLLAAKEKIDRQIADIDQALIDPLRTIGGRYEFPELPGQGVRLQKPSKRFNPDLAVQVLSPTQYQSICVLVPNAARARQVLPGALVDQCYAEGGKPSIQALRSNGGQR